jgi:carboxymethylenebutenolidase
VELDAAQARQLIAGVNSTDLNRTITAAANYGMMLPAAEQKYTVTGFCWGGTASWDHAINGGVKGFAGAVPFYGTPYTTGGGRATASSPATPAVVNTDSLKKIQAPVMMFSGSKDARITALMPQIDSAMKALGKTYTGTNYEGAVHGFVRAQNDPKSPTRDEAEEAANFNAIKDAWPKTIAFMKKQLGVK